MYTVCLHYSLSEFKSGSSTGTDQPNPHPHPHRHFETSSSSSSSSSSCCCSSTIIVNMATTTTTATSSSSNSSTSTTSSSASSGYGTATTATSSGSTPPTTPPEHPSSPLELHLDHLPPERPALDRSSNSSTPSSTLNRRSPSPSSIHLKRFVPSSPSSQTSTSATVHHHPNFANHVSEHSRRLHRHHPPPSQLPSPSQQQQQPHHHNSYSSSTTGTEEEGEGSVDGQGLYQAQNSMESGSGSPPPYTDTMDSRTAAAAAAAAAAVGLGGRGRLDSAATATEDENSISSSVDSFKVVTPTIEEIEVDDHQRPSSSSRDVHHDHSSAPSTSRFLTTVVVPQNQQQQQQQQQPKQDQQQQDQPGKLGHRRVDENGEVTYKHIQSTQIMYSIQLGIGHSVGSLASKPERDVLYNDFNTVETVHFPVRGSTTTPAHHYADFDFTTYTPNAFRHFRDLFRIQPEDYMLSMTAVPLRELSNPGASGSVFYITDDDQFIVKTVEKTESKFLLKLLPGYYMNLSQNPHTLLPKFFGLYTFECSGKNIRILVMNNLLPSDVRLHEKYDLKGSTYKRKASEGERSKRSPTFKDLDFLERYHLLERYSRSTVTLHKAKGRARGEVDELDQYSTIGSHYGGHAHLQMSTMTLPNGTVNGVEHEETAFGGLQLEAPVYDELMNTLNRDCRVLESFEIMDYSLLVGVHNYDRQLKEGGKGSVAFDYEDDESLPPGAIRASNHKGERLLLFIGIIDILQSYRLFKKVEHAWKALLHDGDTVSVHRPKFYARRFLNFMQKYVFARVSPPGSSKNDDKYSLYYQVARQRKDSAWNNSASTLQRSISQHPTYAAHSYASAHYR